MDMGFYDELKRETGEKWLEIINKLRTRIQSIFLMMKIR